MCPRDCSVDSPRLYPLSFCFLYRTIFLPFFCTICSPQYYLGPDLVVSPIVTQLDSGTGLASQPLWTPPGIWTERANGLLRTVRSPEVTRCADRKQRQPKPELVWS